MVVLYLILKQRGEDQPSYVCSSFPNGLDKQVPGCKLVKDSLLCPLTPSIWLLKPHIP